MNKDEDSAHGNDVSATLEQQQRKCASDIGLTNPSTNLTVTRMTHQKNDRLRIVNDDKESVDGDVAQHKRRKLVSDLNECQ